MAQTLTQCFIHFIFSTKNRVPMISPEIEPSLFAYINGIARNHKSVILAINGTTDHVHILMSMAKILSMSDCMENIKGDSSRWIKTQGAQFAEFGWQDGYAGFSVSESVRPAVARYIGNQKKHHLGRSFQEELIIFSSDMVSNMMSGTFGREVRPLQGRVWRAVRQPRAALRSALGY